MNIKNDFQPMPKRFMVWDSKEKEFIPHDDNFCFMRDEDDNLHLCEIDWWSKDLVEVGIDRYIIIQSTNLFDKDGKEIFEGSIVENHFIHKFGLVYYDEDVAGWRILYQDGTWDDLYYVKADIVVAGHILSSPELLEERDV